MYLPIGILFFLVMVLIASFIRAFATHRLKSMKLGFALILGSFVCSIVLLFFAILHI